ncbi:MULTISPECIES: response regulator [Serratia]|jgi:two-component system response regulator EvgA|uniref:Response regulator n=2 Tax=Serratia TaxID=613 RepID=A0A515CQL4_SERLI|nr:MULTISPECIES: response regulator [Serratia]MBI6163216.1 response regulator [Serratia liquefaciens]MBV0844638.1 response regulator [Serratia liquefaciens]MCS4318815.1 two-component system response regulator EvgA [Serratia sp. BIGb0234]MDU5487756.1 response regulator [Serratia liquefaciens]OKP19252.1 DNA-binding response regulator [Serratia liquefaciens]
MKSVLVVDDHPVTRFAIKVLLEKEGLRVISETGDGFEALSLIEKHKPDLVIVDIDIHSISGIELVQRLRKRQFSGAILVLSGKDEPYYIKNCVGAGADGFISKANNLCDLHSAVAAISAGYGYFPLKQARQQILQPGEDKQKNAIASLSAKELQVLRYLAKGMRLVDIGLQMNISDKTVGTYKRRVMAKLDLNSMMETYEFCIKNNLD